jgi:DNA polymerase-4
MADRLYQATSELLAHVADPGPFRLIGVGLSDIVSDASADLTPDLLDPGAARRAGAERATDAIRARFGPDAIVKGRSLR